MSEPKNPTRLVGVIDLETTGLVPKDGLIVEAGLAIVEPSLEVVNSTCAVIRPPEGVHPDAVVAMMDEKIVKPMHEANGLIDELRDGHGVPLDTWARGARVMMTDAGIEAQSMPLLGSNVRFDRNWLEVHAYDLEQFFHYRIIDVSSLKEVMRRWFPEAFQDRPTKEEHHRVSYDIEETLEELRFYLRYLGTVVAIP